MAADTSALADASDGGDGGACDPTKPFGAAVPIAEINQPNSSEDSFYPAVNSTLAFFSTDRPADGGFDASGTGLYEIYEAKRANASLPWGSLRVLPLNSGPYPTRDPVLSEDGLDLFYTIGPNFDILRSTRTSLSVEFAAGTTQTALSSAQADQATWISIDKLRLYIASNRTNNANKIFLADLSGTPTVNMLGTPINDPSGEDTGAVLTADELHIVFASTRPGGGGNSMNVWEAGRASKTAAWNTPTPVVNATSNSPDYPAALSPDGCTLYITRAQAGGYNVYVLTRPQ